jgi:hypothetical protein
VDSGGLRRFQPFGEDVTGSWPGFQVSRAGFDAMLLARARAAGVTVDQPCTVTGLLRASERIAGVMTAEGPVTALVVVDASGRSHWLACNLGIGRLARSPRLPARYGYARRRMLPGARRRHPPWWRPLGLALDGNDPTRRLSMDPGDGRRHPTHRGLAARGISRPGGAGV